MLPSVSRQILTIALSCATVSPILLASSREADAAPTVLVETDPATFAFGGFALHVRVAPGDGHLVVGAGGYALDFPAMLVDLDAANRDEEWNVRLTLGAGAFTDYYFAGRSTGWFVGGQLALQRYRYTNEAAPGEAARATNLLVMPRFGLSWSPSPRLGLYLMPWLGLGYTSELAGDHEVGGSAYHVRHAVPYAAVHVGWRF